MQRPQTERTVIAVARADGVIYRDPLLTMAALKSEFPAGEFFHERGLLLW